MTTLANSADIYAKALETVRERRSAAQERADAEKARLYNDVPELSQLDSKIYSVFAQAAKKSLAGGKVDFDAAEAESLRLQEYKRELLGNLNLTEEDLQPHFSCKLCEDTGYYNGKLCECVKLIAAKMIFDEINKDVPLENSTFESFDLKYYSDKPNESGVSPRSVMSRIKQACERYAQGFSPKSDSILFFGRTGLGKTHLSLSIANEVIAKGYNVVYAPIARILQQIEREYFSRENKDSKTLESVINCDLLIIDDLGTEFKTSFVTSTIYDIINSRILSGKPTLINTNLSLEELESQYSERVVSRISHGYKKFTFVGEDVRTLL